MMIPMMMNIMKMMVNLIRKIKKQIQMKIPMKKVMLKVPMKKVMLKVPMKMKSKL